MRKVSLYSVYKCMGVCLQILQTYQLKVEFLRIRTKIYSCCLLTIYGSDNDDNQTALSHKEHIKVGRAFKLLNLLGWWRYFGEIYMYQLLTSGQWKSRYDYHFIKLTKFLHSFSGVRKGGVVIIKFNHMFPYATYHFQGLYKISSKLLLFIFYYFYYSCISMLKTLQCPILSLNSKTLSLS